MVMDETVQLDTQVENSEKTDVAMNGVSYGSTACYRGLVRKEYAEEQGVDLSMWQSPMNVIGKDKVKRFVSTSDLEQMLTVYL
jgi:hypothetical protein